MDKLLTTQLYKYHLEQKSKLIDFAGWEMPFSYDGTLKEHNYVRNSCGFFDVSHMGRLIINIDEIDNISKLICSDIINLDNSKALYTIFTNKNGKSLDDVIFWKFEEKLVLICNASNREKISKHLNINGIKFDDQTFDTCLIAIQGPDSEKLMNNLIDSPARFSAIDNGNYIYARTGYTGEDGFEIMFNNSKLNEVMKYINDKNINPCGLGSRDTLRLEASLPLYGFELSEEISPIEANLKWVLTNKEDYLGKDKIEDELNNGKHKILKKFIINSKKIARTGTKVKNNNINGVVTSGNYSPILEKSIGYALFDSNPESDLIEFDIRGNFIEGNIINKRFLS
ncbi:MAG: glycine cleavage system aminomethyltransferase GcvT [Candidatus Actinomarinales bacterium]|nr:MAG: glycine cleavage system aminomethyltransferase GcvT [Candidatus Actinomarinales bacterium]|tara:strand:- start:26224 stop:27246 length:1023 start_codon:yes stop_codon:yes gene_type:complete